jgi:hypothetical protein
MSEIREYSHVELSAKALNPVHGPKTVIRNSVQLKASNRLVLYRDMDHAETLIATSEGITIEYPWTLVVSARLAQPKVVPIQTGGAPAPGAQSVHPRR